MNGDWQRGILRAQWAKTVGGGHRSVGWEYFFSYDRNEGIWVREIKEADKNERNHEMKVKQKWTEMSTKATIVQSQCRLRRPTYSFFRNITPPLFCPPKLKLFNPYLMKLENIVDVSAEFGDFFGGKKAILVVERRRAHRQRRRQRFFTHHAWEEDNGERVMIRIIS